MRKRFRATFQMVSPMASQGTWVAPAPVNDGFEFAGARWTTFLLLKSPTQVDQSSNNRKFSIWLCLEKGRWKQRHDAGYAVTHRERVIDQPTPDQSAWCTHIFGHSGVSFTNERFSYNLEDCVVPGSESVTIEIEVELLATSRPFVCSRSSPTWIPVTEIRAMQSLQLLRNSVARLEKAALRRRANVDCFFLEKDRPTATRDDMFSDGIRLEQDEVLKLSVGGTLFETTRSTLAKVPDTMLSMMFSTKSGLMPSVQSNSGSYFLDASPSQFNRILDYYRYGVVALPSSCVDLNELALQADYFLLADLAVAVRRAIRQASA